MAAQLPIKNRQRGTLLWKSISAFRSTTRGGPNLRWLIDELREKGKRRERKAILRVRWTRVARNREPTETKANGRNRFETISERSARTKLQSEATDATIQSNGCLGAYMGELESGHGIYRANLEREFLHAGNSATAPPTSETSDAPAVGITSNWHNVSVRHADCIDCSFANFSRLRQRFSLSNLGRSLG